MQIYFCSLKGTAAAADVTAAAADANAAAAKC